MGTYDAEGKDIAVIGMACRFPGAFDYTEFWDNLIQGKTFTKKMPRERWDSKALTGMKQQGAKDLDVISWGNFIDDIDTFDVEFFGISDREAETMEPQQKILLELTWNCFEDACICPSDLSGKNVGVFVSEFGNDFKELVSQNLDTVQPHHLSGTSQCIIANRISYQYNFTGPSMTIDTACSGALTALHAACQSIYQEESKVAVVAGTSLLLSPVSYISMTQMRMLSPTGYCKTFDENADGYVRGEGAGVILLKPLNEALKDGDVIHGIIKGSAVNHGGKVRSITRPNDQAQADLIVQAVKNASVYPGSITYIETHGTGTPKGDPIEIEGLKKAFQKLYEEDLGHDYSDTCVGLGTAKSSIGHLEAAAGLAGVIKVLLSLENKMLPKLAGYQKLNHRISLNGTPFYIVDSTKKWERKRIGDEIVPRRAGISSFGFGGSNGHMILEEAPEREKDISKQSSSCRYYYIVLSAKSKAALERNKILLQNFLENKDMKDSDMADIEWSLLSGRELFDQRFCIICDNVENLKIGLKMDSHEGRIVISTGEEVSYQDGSDFELLSRQDLLFHFKQCKSEHKAEYLQLLKTLGIYLLNEKENWDWSKIFLSHGERIALPGYFFERRHYKMPYFNVEKVQLCAPMCKLLHVNCSNFEKQCYRSVFNCNDSFVTFMKENEKTVCSSAMLCSMAQSAIADAMETEETIILRNALINIDLVEKHEALRLETEIKKQAEGLYLVEIRDEHDYRHLGYFEYYKEIPLKEEAHRLKHPEFIKGKDFHALLEDSNISYDTENLQLEYLETEGSDEWIRYSFMETDSFSNTLNIIDCVLQGSVLKCNQKYSGIQVRLDSIRMEGYCNSQGLICLKYTQKDVCSDIYICDIEGRSIIEIKGIAVLESERSKEDKDKQEKLFKFVWKQVEPEYEECNKKADTVIVTSSLESANRIRDIFLSSIVIKPDDLSTDMESNMKQISGRNVENILWETDSKQECISEQMIKDQDKGIYLLYEFIRKLLYMGYAKKALNFTVLTYNTQYIKETDKVYAGNSGIWGLMGVVAKEYRKWNVCLFDGEYKADISTELLTGLKKAQPGKGYGYRDGKLYSRVLKEVDKPIVKKSIYRQQGVYVIVGGAGGIGQIWTRYMIQNYRANVIWIGRSSRDKRIEDKLAGCEIAGIRPDYIPADITSAESIKKAYDVILQKYKKINGVVHSAIGALDRSIQEMDREEFKSIISVKMDGAVYLAEIFSKAKLDFLVFFSSIASILKLAGQSGYVSGSGFLDMLAHQLDIEEGINAKAINWGYWGNVGIGRSMPVSSVRKIEMSGIGVIEPEHAMQAMEGILTGEDAEYMYTSVEKSIFAESFELAEDSAESREALCIYLKEIFRKMTSLPRQAVSLSDSFEQYGLNEITLSRYLDMLHKRYKSVTGDMIHEFVSLEEVADYILEHEDLQAVIQKEGNFPKKDQGLSDAVQVQADDKNTQAGKSRIVEHMVPYLKKMISEETGISVQRIRSDVQLEQYGLDSIMIIHLTDALKENISKFESTVFFEYTTIDEIATYMTEHFGKEIQAMLHIEMSAVRVEAEARTDREAKMVTEIQERTIGHYQGNIGRGNEETIPTDMALAIVGMSGRFPMADNLNQFWENIKNARNCVTEIPEERWELEGFYTPDVSEAVEKNLSYCKWGGMIDDFASFDSMFFGISPKEAMNMDPQERLFLEESYKVFQDAGYTKQRLFNKYKNNVGVFAGVTQLGYEWFGSELRKRKIKIRPNTSFSAVANRVSYYFNLNGPSIALDTMCSSSLSALHAACESVRYGQCRMAVAGGVNIYTHPSTYEYLCQMHMLSKTGQCHTFGDNADGFVPGEGVGVVLIKSLKDAMKDRDNIYAIIRGSNVNHGGKTNGFTVPSLGAQRNLVAQTFEKAGIDADMVSYIEAHGTGTILGDPIEVSALTQAFGQTTQRKQFCAISSVKTNIGHLEGAAGIAGVIKTVLQMRHKVYVPHINAEILNPRINFCDSPFFVPKELKEWKRPAITKNGTRKEYPLIAGVSAFGAGGANAHVVIEEFDSELNG